jgi:hypothetical protein
VRSSSSSFFPARLLPLTPLRCPFVLIEHNSHPFFVHRTLERRIATHPPGEVMFNLMCVTSRRASLRARLAELEKQSEGGDETALLQASEVREKLEGIEEKLKDWEVEVRVLSSLPFRPSDPFILPLHVSFSSRLPL